MQFLSVPADLMYIVQMQGYEQGNFSLDVDKQTGNEITESTSFQGIPSSTSTVATINVTPDFEIATSTLNLDQDGSGTADKILHATLDGITVYDTTSPELQITFGYKHQRRRFSAQDLSDPHPTIFTTSTSTTLSDNSDNTTIIPFTKYKEKPTRLKLSYNTIVRNGVATTVPNTHILYDWQEKKGF